MLSLLTSLVFDQNKINGVKFEHQQNNESIKLFVRQHFVVNVGWILRVIILLVIPGTILFFQERILTWLGITPLNAIFSRTEILIFAITYSLAVLYASFIKFTGWYFNVLIATNQRLIDLTIYPPFSWEITQAQLADIQDIRHTQGGFLGITFNYGNIFVQTAGTAQNIAINNVPDPNRIHDILIQLLP